jgi:adenylate kinase
MLPSEEQEKVINLITENNSVVVNSVAGAGKTTTLLFIAEKNPNKNILQITYNKQLKLEVRNKIKKYNIKNVEIHTYHSLAVKNYDPSCHTDDNIIKVLKNDIQPKNKIKYDIIVIDEVQDMTPNYYELVYKFMKDINFNSTILILGDNFQGVYEFKNADTRYLTLSHKIWKINEFTQLTLNQSYRVTKQIAWFVNNAMLGYDRIISHKDGMKIYYYKKNLYTVTNEIFTKIKSFLLQNYKPEDIFILSPTIRSTNNPVKKLENIMVKNNIPVYFSRNEEEGIDEEIIAGKAVFTTFHQSKGRERKIVIVFGFDDTYFEFYAKEKKKDICPSELYVAVTRSSDILMLIQHEKNDPLSFLKMTEDQLKSNPNIEFIEIKKKTAKQIEQKKEKDLINIHNTSVNDLTSYLSELTMREIIPMLSMIFTIISYPQDKYTVDIPLNVKMKNGLVEDVSDLNGLVIPAMYEAGITKKKSTIHQTVEHFCQNANKENSAYIEKKKQELLKHRTNAISVYLLLGNLYIALTENILSKLNQIDKYDWLTNDIIKVCHKNIKLNIKHDAKYEQIIANEHDNCFTYKHEKYGNISIKGRIDAYDNDSLWEIKCTSKLNVDHMLQLIIYAWMWENCMTERFGQKKFRILNIRTGEVLELKYEEYIIKDIIELIFVNKYEPKTKDSDILFLEKCKRVRRRYDNRESNDYIVIND